MIPWTTLVKHAPVILAAAETLLARARSGKTPDAASESVERLRKLEQSAAESAQLLHDIAQQVHALTAMQEETAKRARLALALSIAAVILAAAAGLVVLLT